MVSWELKVSFDGLSSVAMFSSEEIAIVKKSSVVEVSISGATVTGTFEAVGGVVVASSSSSDSPSFSGRFVMICALSSSLHNGLYPAIRPLFF